jgi:hypothetical protein
MSDKNRIEPSLPVSTEGNWFQRSQTTAHLKAGLDQVFAPIQTQQPVDTAPQQETMPSQQSKSDE